MPAAKPNRPSLGFGDELDELEVGFAPPRKTPKPAPEASRKVAEATGFRSREARQPSSIPASAPAPMAPKPQQRRRRTGRNAQINLKAKPETIEAFTRIADAKGWGLGEAFEHATALLVREHASR